LKTTLKEIIGIIIAVVVIAGVLSLPPRDTSPENDYGVLRR